MNGHEYDAKVPFTKEQQEFLHLLIWRIEHGHQDPYEDAVSIWNDNT